MSTAKVYKDIEGNECDIHQMVSREPQWAAARILEGEKAIERSKILEAMLKKKLDLIRCGIEVSYSGDAKENKLYIEAVELIDL